MLIRLGLASATPPRPAVLADLADLLDATPVEIERPGWWSAQLTADVDPNLAVQARRRAIANGLDAAVTTGELLTAGPGLVVSDVDSTLICDEVIELLAEHAGERSRVAEITEAAMRGELDFATSLATRVETLSGVSAEVIEKVISEIVLSPGSVELIAALQSCGTQVGVVSGGFAEVVAPIIEPLGITLMKANRLEIVDGKLTGRTVGPVVDGSVKQSTLRQWADECAVGLARTVAIGDGANDVAMLSQAAFGIAFCAKPVVAARADAAITFPRLDAVLGLLGLPSPGGAGH